MAAEIVVTLGVEPCLQDAVRQHGVLVFEATPEQQLSVGPEVRAHCSGVGSGDLALSKP